VVPLEGTHEFEFLVGSLEATMSKLGRGIDELEGNLLQGVTGSLGLQGFAEGNDSLPWSSNATLQHDVILVDDTIVGEATEGCDSFLGVVELGGSVVLSFGGEGGFAYAVDLLVALCAVMVTILSCTCNGVAHTRRMPGSDTSNLAKTFVGFAGKLGDTPTLYDTLESVTLGDADGVDHLILGEHTVHRYGFLKEGIGKVHLLGNGTTVDLDFHDVGLLLTGLDLADLGVDDGTNHSGILLDAGELTVDSPPLVVGEALGVLAERLLLGTVPVLVKATLNVFTKVGSPNGGKGTEALGSLDVSNQSNNNDGWALKDGNSLQNFTLVHLGSQLVQITNNVGHTSLVSQEGGDMGWF